MSRSKAREAAVMLLFEWAANGEPEKSELEVLHESVDIDGINADDESYISEVVNGCKRSIDQIDRTIKDNCIDWSPERLPRVDLAVLRLGTYELLEKDDIPKAVTINECVEIVKHYSTEKSGAFVNGVLSAINRSRKDGSNETDSGD